MSDNEMLYCLIAFILGFIVCRYMGNGFSVGVGVGDDKHVDLPDGNGKSCYLIGHNRKPGSGTKAQCKICDDVHYINFEKCQGGPHKGRWRHWGTCGRMGD